MSLCSLHMVSQLMHAAQLHHGCGCEQVKCKTYTPSTSEFLQIILHIIHVISSINLYDYQGTCRQSFAIQKCFGLLTVWAVRLGKDYYL